MRVATLRAEPSQIQFSEMKMDGASDGENTVRLLRSGRREPDRRGFDFRRRREFW